MSTARPGPRDYNRSARREVAPSTAPLIWGYRIFLVAAVVMLLSAFIGFSSLDDVPVYVRSNRLTVAIVNAVGAVLLVIGASLLPSGRGRVLCSIVTGIASFVAVAALAIGIGGLLLMVIPLLLISGIFMIFRPAANLFVKEAQLERLRQQLA